MHRSILVFQCCSVEPLAIIKNPFNPDAAKTLDKFCGDGGSITVGIGARGSIPVVVDEAMGAAADTLRPDVRLHDEVVPE
eukprot:scaffold38421_cov63-Attheya_sp.AAC.3